jgi:hypothetical protein
MTTDSDRIPTAEQLSSFYRVVREGVLLSNVVEFVELGEDGKLYVSFGRCEDRGYRVIARIAPKGETSYE